MKGFALVLVLVVSALLFLGDAKQVAACTCIPHSVEEAVDRADAVFAGRVMFIGRDVDIQAVYGTQNLVGFWVNEVWKGPVRGLMYVTANPNESSCGFNFRTGREYLVYASESSVGYSTGLCSGTKSLRPDRPHSEILVDLEALGEGRVPSQWGEDRVSGLGPFGVREWLFVLVIAAFILTMCSVVGYKCLRKR